MSSPSRKMSGDAHACGYKHPIYNYILLLSYNCVLNIITIIYSRNKKYHFWNLCYYIIVYRHHNFLGLPFTQNLYYVFIVFKKIIGILLATYGWIRKKYRRCSLMTIWNFSLNNKKYNFFYVISIISYYTLV